MDTLLGRGIYSFADAARLTKLKQSRVREWFGQSGHTRPVFSGDYEPVEGDYAISFLDLIDVFIAGQLREHGLALQTVRRVYLRLREEFHTAHPFCRQEMLSDGKLVLLRGSDKDGQAELNEVLTRQRVLTHVLLPFLKRIDYGAVSKLAERWRIARDVVVDPTICFGQPVVEAVGVPTAILAAAHRANGEDADLVADWYNVHPEHVLAAVQFETTVAA